MYKVIYRTSRESKAVAFYVRPDNVLKLIQEEKKQGRLLTEYIAISEDGLVKKYVGIWRDKGCLESFNQQDEVKQFVKRKVLYDQSVGNITNIIGEEINE